MPGETRTWKVFLLDIWKQLASSFFSHFLNILLAIELRAITKSGNGCVWYLVNFLLDFTAGMFLAFVLFKIVDTIAIMFNIEVLKSGVYTSEEVSMVDGDPDKQIDVRIWVLQVFVWTSCVFTGKIIVFFQCITFYKPLLAFGNAIMEYLNLN